MAARLRPWQQEEVRSRIKTQQLIEVLQKHGLNGKGDEISPSRVRAIEILLRKTTPDLQSVEHSGEVVTSYVMSAPPVEADAVQWSAKYQPH